MPEEKAEVDMKVVLVGASGLIGRAVAAELGPRHEIVAVSRKSGVALDITDAGSIRAAFQKIGRVDAVVSTTGSATFGPLETLKPEDFEVGLKDKLMGQVRLVLIGREFVNDGGSFTLTSGILADEAIRAGCALSMVNGALNAFVMAAAVELPRGLRINVVSPGVITEAMEAYGPFFRGFEPVPAARAALAYSKSLEGVQTGQVYRVV
jgi:NAD(P)-dependent dehydrogenase (short-subunit alcohol dehydrogenase family)